MKKLIAIIFTLAFVATITLAAGVRPATAKSGKSSVSHEKGIIIEEAGEWK